MTKETVTLSRSTINNLKDALTEALNNVLDKSNYTRWRYNHDEQDDHYSLRVIEYGLIEISIGDKSCTLLPAGAELLAERLIKQADMAKQMRLKDVGKIKSKATRKTTRRVRKKVS